MADDLLYFTENEVANRLLARDPLALLIGLALYQQVPVEKAFAGPLVLRERLGGALDPAAIAAMSPDDLEAVFKQTPAIHRFPGSMAKRVQGLCSVVATEYGGRPERIWQEASDIAEVRRRLKTLPGFGDYKVTVTITILALRLDVHPIGWEDAVANYPTVADIDGPGQLDDFKARKKAWKSR